LDYYTKIIMVIKLDMEFIKIIAYFDWMTNLVIIINIKFIMVNKGYSILIEASFNYLMHY